MVAVLVTAVLTSCEHESSTNELLDNVDALINVTGTWTDVAGDGSQTTITLTQSGNDVAGTFVTANGWTGTIAGRVNGNSIDLTYVYSDGYVVHNSATVNDSTMNGTFQSADGSRQGTWTATRVSETRADIPEPVPEPQPEPEPEEQELSFEQVALYYMFEHEETFVIRSQEEWDHYLTQASLLQFNPIADQTDPNCTFAENMLVAHSFGVVQADSSFLSVDVTTVTLNAGTISVNISVDVQDPPDDDYTSDGEMYMGFGVCIPQSDSPVEVVVSYY